MGQLNGPVYWLFANEEVKSVKRLDGCYFSFYCKGKSNLKKDGCNLAITTKSMDHVLFVSLKTFWILIKSNQ